LCDIDDPCEQLPGNLAWSGSAKVTPSLTVEDGEHYRVYVVATRVVDGEVERSDPSDTFTFKAVRPTVRR
jgi:hypothetical protein